MPYTFKQVLAIGRIHPFYNTDVEYPPDPETVVRISSRVQEDGDGEATSLDSCGLLWKKILANTIHRLNSDPNPQNTYRVQAYTSITGGGSGSKPVPFLTDTFENRKQRAEFGQFLRLTGVVNERDWVLTVHSAGDLYRSLDLTTEILECAGASVLCAGISMSMDSVVRALQEYRCTVLTGESSHLVRIIHYISTLPLQAQNAINLTKIIYTSEVFTRSQRALLKSVLGETISICSIIGSAEAGPWAIHNPDLTGVNMGSSVEDFVYDTRAIHIEIFPPSLTIDSPTYQDLKPLPEGEIGLIVQTSLTRLRHPIIRYNTGDIGSIHPLPSTAQDHLTDKTSLPYLRVIRFAGRDTRYSFKWDSMVFDLANITAFLEREEMGILTWQLILDEKVDTKGTTLEVRILRAAKREGTLFLGKEEVEEKVRGVFDVNVLCEDRFAFRVMDGWEGFERSETGRKIIRFVDRTKRDEQMNKPMNV